MEVVTEELLTTIDISQFISTLKVNSLNKLKEFSERAGRRTISELNQIIDATELNEFLRMVYNDEHPTFDSKQVIRSIDYMIEKINSNGDKIIKASKMRGLSFCTNLSQFVKIAKLKAQRSKNVEENIHIYILNEDAQLPRGLAFNKDSPGHVSLIATQDMTWNDMISKLKMVSDTLEYFTTIRIVL